MDSYLLRLTKSINTYNKYNKNKNMINIINKIEFENNCWVGLVDSSKFNSSEENRINAVTDVASITQGKLGQNYKEEQFTDIICKRRENLYNRLLTESAGKPSTPFEFVPIIRLGFNDDVTPINDTYFNNYFKYGYSKNYNFYTNLRNELMNSKYIGKQMYNIPEDIKDFKVIAGRVPMKVISHLRTHRAFSWLVESSRNKRYLNKVEFWYPSWWKSETVKRWNHLDNQLLSILEYQIYNKMITPEEATMELSDRRLVHFAMAAWKQDTNAWDNLFAVRGDKTGTMSITGITVDNIKKLICHT